MPRGDWRKLAKIGGIGFAALAAITILVAAALYSYREFYEPAEQDSAAQSYQPARDSTRPRRENHKPPAPKYDPHCEQPQSHDDADLCAQWAAVRAVSETNRITRIALKLGYVGFWIAFMGGMFGIIGTVLIWLAWRETKAANRIARRDYGRARLEARNAAKIAEKQLADAGRPHLIVASIEIEDLEALPLEEKVAIKYMFSNHGPSPAWMIAHGVWLSFTPPDAIPDTFNVEGAHKTYWPIPPGQGWGVKEFDRESGTEILPPMRKAIIDGTVKLLAFGIVTCIDANGREHSNTFVYEYNVKRKMLIPMQHPFWKYT